MVGEKYWRSLDELADTPEFHSFVEREFPGLAGELDSPRTRRAFLKVMGASLGIAGLTSCRWPKEHILPFASQPENRTPGVPQRFATAMELGGAAIGLLVTSYDGRPIKIEGNPRHPISQGAATAFAQASLLDLYDPDRSKTVIRRENGQEIAAKWEDFTAFAGPHFAALRAAGGEGLVVVSEESSSPSIARLRARFAQVFPHAKWFEYEPLSRRMGMENNEGQHSSRRLFHLDRADLILCVDADPFANDPAALRYARDYAAGRSVRHGRMNRLLVVESALSLTGAVADQRWALPPVEVVQVVDALLLRHMPKFADFDRNEAPGRRPFVGKNANLIADYISRELFAHKGKAAVFAGMRHDGGSNALARVLNESFGSEINSDIVENDRLSGWVDPIELASYFSHASDSKTLLILGGNPVHNAPADAEFAKTLAAMPNSIHLSLYDNETSQLCRWHINRAHYLEAWGDVRAVNGVVSIQQPLIEPLYGGKTTLELLANIMGEGTSNPYEILRQNFRETFGNNDFEAAWKTALRHGVVGHPYPPIIVRDLPVTQLGFVGRFGLGLPEGEDAAATGLTAIFTPSASVYDGRFANNAWLQEAPDPLTKLTWDNAAYFSPKTAQRLGIAHGDLVKLTLDGRDLEIASYVMPGQADETVVLPLGYGRTRAGRVGNGVGFDTYRLRTSKNFWIAPGVKVEKTGRRHKLACTQDHYAIDRVGFAERGRRVGELVREGTLAEYKAHPHFATNEGGEPTLFSLWQEKPYTGEHQWAMAIDLSACIGCNACVVACQAENNVPVVGKDQVTRGRAMHWLRLDRYFVGSPENPRVAFQPLACHHCESAPCEQVCPVGATMHSEEGLNQQVYNRCVGTRYCSNNCPYKVRRFNFLNYFKHLPETEKMLINPEVTVRSRGVMEKCTCCVQRISIAKIAAKNERRPLKDGDIIPACAQTCPTQAIVFGDLKDPSSRVAKLHQDERAYAMLGELNIKPRTRYLARLRNPLAGETSHE